MNPEQHGQLPYPPQPGQGYPPQQPGGPGFQQQPPPYQPYPPQGPGGPNQAGYNTGFPGGVFGGQQAIGGLVRTQAMGGYDSDVEGGAYPSGIGNAFEDQAVRRGFIRKVYGILSIQLLVTCAIILPFTVQTGLRDYARQNRWMYWTAFALTMVCMIAMVCCESVRRKAPTNYIFLGIFTVCEGILLGSLAAFFEADAVLIAAGITAGVTIGLTVFAFQTKIDFTNCGGMLCGLLVVLLIAGLLLAILPSNKYAMIGYGSAGAIIFSLYIVYDTQLMMGGKHKYALDPEEYIFATLNIYLDVINLFLYILMIIGAARSD